MRSSRSYGLPLKLGVGLAVLGLALTACGSSSGGDSAGSGAASAAAGEFGVTQDAALAAKVPAQYKDGVKIAVFNDWAPDMWDDNGNLKGWSVDMAHAMSTMLGVKFDYTSTGFETILPGLQNKRFDAGFTSFAPLPDRLKVLDFVAQRRDGSTFATLTKNNITIAKAADLCGHSVAVLAGAADFQSLQKVNASECGSNKITIKQFPTQSAAELSVKSGQNQVIAGGTTKIGYLVKQTGTMTLASYNYAEVYTCIGVRKGDPLGPVMEQAVDKMIADGTYKKIMAKWGVDNSGVIDKSHLLTEADPNGEAA